MYTDDISVYIGTWICLSYFIYSKGISCFKTAIMRNTNSAVDPFRIPLE